MTTQVIIKSPSPNHENILIEVKDSEGITVDIKMITDGEEVSLYVHDHQTLKIKEIPKVRS